MKKNDWQAEGVVDMDEWRLNAADIRAVVEQNGRQMALRQDSFSTADYVAGAIAMAYAMGVDLHSLGAWILAVTFGKLDLGDRAAEPVPALSDIYYGSLVDAQDFARRLLDVTKDCRPDMHEPDEQGLDAIMTGWDFNNSAGDEPYDYAMGRGYGHGNLGEMTVALVKSNNGDDVVGRFWFNLATLFAFARIGAFVMLNDIGKADAALKGEGA